jgi:hypothetical protein
MIRRRQTGVITLAVGMLLMLGSSILALGVTRMAVMEQRIANNEQRAKEAHQAAQGALDLASDWLTTNRWGPGAALPTPSPTAGSGDFSYLTQLEAALDVDCIRVTAHAQAASDPNITATTSDCYRQEGLLNTALGSGPPPLVVNGCMTGVTGTPDIYPLTCDPVTDPACDPVAVASSQPETCLDTGRFYLNGGSVRAEAFVGSAWDYLFAVSKDEMRALAAEADTNVIWITSTRQWTLPSSSPADPVILIFDTSAGCPKLNGNPTIYGIVYYEHPDGCGSQGWGGADIFGAVVFEGSLTKFTSNAALRHWSLAGDDDTRAALDPVRGAVRVPGRWRDWD